MKTEEELKKDIIDYYKGKEGKEIEKADKLLFKTAINNFKAGKQKAQEDILKLIDEWYKGWKKDKSQEFWKDDLEELKQKIKNLEGKG